MNDYIKHIGSNAGKIWKELNEHETLSQHELKENTQLNNDDFHMAIGWLANENKIDKSKEKDVYTLGESTIAQDIEKKAHLVLEMLQDQSKKNVASIAKSAELRPMEVYTALGWLAREDKIMVFQDRTLQNKYSLKNNST